MSRIFHPCIFDLPVFSGLAFSVAPKKPLPAHTHEEEEEGFAQTRRRIAWELIPFTVL